MFGPSRSRYCDMFPGQIRLVRHVRLQPTPLERHVPRQIPLLRHVPIQPIPPERHVPRADPATATCSAPADRRQSDMFPGRSGYSDMFASSGSPPERHVPRQVRLQRHVRLQPIPLERRVPRADPATATCWAPADRRQSDMFPGQIRLLRHVRLQPIPLVRHVVRADPATATCSDPADPARATCSPADPATATCFRSAGPVSATCCRSATSAGCPISSNSESRIGARWGPSSGRNRQPHIALRPEGRATADGIAPCRVRRRAPYHSWSSCARWALSPFRLAAPPAKRLSCPPPPVRISSCLPGT